MMQQTLSSATPDNEAAQSGGFGRSEKAGEPSVVDAFKAIERIESRLTDVAPGVSSSTPAGIEDTLRGFENRISTLTERLSSGVRPIGRRGVTQETDLNAAVAQIRNRQADLDQGQSRPRPASPAEPVLDRSHGDVLSALRGDMARLSNQIEASRGPERAAIDHLNREFAGLRSSLGSLATRADVSQIEQSVADLSNQVVQARVSGSGLAEASAQFKTLQAAIARLTEAQAIRDDGRVSSEIERLSAKLDGMATRAEPALRDALTGQLNDIRAMMAEAAAPAQIATLNHHVSSLRDEVAALSARQVDAQEIAALKASIDDMCRLMSANPGARPAGVGADLASGLKPVEVLLHALVDKLDSVERQVESRSVDSSALDSLERQVANLAVRLGESSGRDPSVAPLDQVLSQLMSELAALRDDVAGDGGRGRDIAELRQRCDATEKRTQDGLAAVNRTLEDVSTRIAALTGERSPKGAEQPSPVSGLVVQGAEDVKAAEAAQAEPSLVEGAALKRLTDAIAADQGRREPPLAESLSPVAAPPEDEILLEPGSARPPVPAAGKPSSDVAVDPADIKTSFIAAARRAAQAAATDAAATRGRMPAAREEGSAGTQSDLIGRIKSMVDKRRRPLLLSAAAVVLAIGTFQIIREGTNTVAPPIVTARAPTLLAELTDANRLARDPETTQSISAAAPTDSAQASSQKPDLPVVPAQNVSSVPASAAQVGAAAPAPTPPAKPATAAVSAAAPIPTAVPAAPVDSGVTTAVLKQAAQGGNAIAAYEYGTRLAEGRGVARDAQLAARFFEKAAEKGLAPAQYRTGNLYEKGIGVARDIEAAKTWYRRAAENGNTRAMHNLAVLLAEGAAGKPDYQSAIAWFERAAAQGMRDSQFNLAVLLARGLGTAQDLPQSYTWFAVAAASGDADSAKKRDEVGSRLSAPDLERAKLAAEHWRVTPPNVAANEVQLPSGGFAESASTTTAAKKPLRDGRV